VLLDDRAGHVLRAAGQGRLLRPAREHNRAGSRLLRLPLMPALAPPLTRQGSAAGSEAPAIDWAAFYERLHAFVASRVRSVADADDLVQLILERAVSKATTTEVTNAAGWLFAIARNAIADHHREQARALLAEADALDGASALGSGEDERAAVIACMEPLLRSLPAETAQLLRWADMEDRSMQAIADELAITLTAAKSRVQRARKDFLAITGRCCAVTMDARGRVTELTPKPTTTVLECGACAPGCSASDRNRS
jgi:RNA polymerase sigma-70 factor, ECF subfamily